jgi:dTMP kinase
MERLIELEKFIPADCRPDLTILFDLPIAVSRERLDRSVAKGRSLDKFEREASPFFERVRNVYLERAAREPGRFRVVDSSRPLAEVQQELGRLLAELGAMR